MENDFNYWEPSVHEDPEQIKRQKKAVEASLTPLSITGNTGVFKGSKKDYHTSLIECQCVDFSRRHLPCKHMYRLAHELNIFPLASVQSDNIISERLRIDDAMAIINDLSHDTKKIFFEFVMSSGSKTQECPEISELIEKKLLAYGDDYVFLLNGYRKIDLLNLLPEDVKNNLPKKFTKADIIDFINNEHHEILENLLGDNIIVRVHPSIEHLQNAIYRRLYSECHTYHDDLADYGIEW